MTDPKNFTDEEIIQKIRDGEDLIDYLLDKYKNLVRKKAGSMFILGADREDLIQEGMIGLLKAVRDYDFGRDASFFTFAELCISRRMYTAVQSAASKKHDPLNGYISLNSYGEETEEGDKKIPELRAGEESSPETAVINRENLERLKQRMEEQLSPFEKQVLDLHIIGMSYVEIAKILGRDEKSTDNALQRVKNKIRKMREE